MSLFLSYFFRLSYGKKKVSEQINRNWIYVFRHYSLFSLTSAKIRISREQKQIFLHLAEAKYLTRSQRYEKTECKSEFFANDRNEAFKVHPNMKKTCRADVFSQKPLILLRENFGSHTRKLLSGTGYRRCLRAVAAAALYVRSSPRLYAWLLNQKHLGPYIRNFRENRAIPLQAKIVSVSLIWLTMGYCIFRVVDAWWWAQLGLFLLAVGTSWHILSFATLRKKE